MGTKHQPNNRGLIIPARMIYSRKEVDDLLKKAYNQMSSSYDYYNALLSPVNRALQKIEVAKQPIITAPLFNTAPDWTYTLNALRSAFNDAVTHATDMIRRVRETGKELDRDATRQINAAMDYTENLILTRSAELNEAITAAIGGGDGGQALNALRNRQEPDLSTIFEDHVNSLKTDNIARDRRFQRYLVYVGIECLIYEAMGLKGIRKQWQAVYAKLQANKDTLAGDAKETWLLWQNQQPLQMRGEDLRRFENEIGRYKDEMRLYYNMILRNSGQTPSK